MVTKEAVVEGRVNCDCDAEDGETDLEPGNGICEGVGGAVIVSCVCIELEAALFAAVRLRLSLFPFFAGTFSFPTLSFSFVPFLLSTAGAEADDTSPFVAAAAALTDALVAFAFDILADDNDDGGAAGAGSGAGADG